MIRTEPPIAVLHDRRLALVSLGARDVLDERGVDVLLRRAGRNEFARQRLRADFLGRTRQAVGQHGDRCGDDVPAHADVPTTPAAVLLTVPARACGVTETPTAAQASRSAAVAFAP